MDTSESSYSFVPEGTNRPENCITDHERDLGVSRENFAGFIMGMFSAMGGPVLLTLAVSDKGVTTFSYDAEEKINVIHHVTEQLPSEWGIGGAVRENGWKLVIFTSDLGRLEGLVMHVQPIIEDTLRTIEQFHATN